MWNEIAGCQIALLLDVQQAWLQEMMKLRSRWKLGRIVTRSLNILLGPVARSQTFTCEHCGREVPAVAPGTRPRSHCPHCLWSLHVEPATANKPVACKGQMEPVAVSTEPGGAWSLVHRCRRCATTHVHAIAVDDNGAALLTIGSRLATRGAPV
jgi:hypothetical protein